MTFVGKTTPTRGALIRLKGTVRFIQEGKDILKMKRDRLAQELNDQIKDLESRKTVEKELMEVYAKMEETLASSGYRAVISKTWTVPKIETEIIPVSIMGVALPRIVVTKRPSLDSIEDVGLYQIAMVLQTLMVDLFSLAQTEASIERVANDLMTTNRKVNALEKIVIPEYERMISYIQDLLFDEDLEDFAKIKHLKNSAGRRTT